MNKQKIVWKPQNSENCLFAKDKKVKLQKN